MKVVEQQVVILVEDSPDDEFLSVRAVRRSGVDCSVVVLRDGAEALAFLLNAPHGPPDLIVLDFNLPGLNGLEILRGLRGSEHTRRIPVVILSSTNEGSALSDCYQSGANSCVQKPVDPVLYQERVQMIVRYWLTINDP